MSKKILEITNDDIYLSLKRGFFCISNNEGKNTDIAIDEILSVIISSDRATLSKNIINAVTEQGGVIILCGKNYMPSSIIIPYSSHWQNGERIRKQISSSVPLQKSLWKVLIRNKISNQARVLEWFSSENHKIERLRILAKTVRSGDSTNNEATASQIYFKALFGKDFVRDRDAQGINALLNYTYIVLRACVARAIAGSGLLPALGIIHTNKLNPFTLVDDLIEPYRALADSVVIDTLDKVDKSNIVLTPEIKRKLTAIISSNLAGTQSYISLPDSLLNTANSLAKSYIEGKNILSIDSYIDRDELIK